MRDLEERYRVDGRPVATGALPAVRAALGLMTYPAQVASVRAARRFAEAVVAATAASSLADDAGLMVSELAANAVLHARTDFDVAVYEIEGGVRISVRDRSPSLPVLVAPSATAMSGRGLALVQTLASQWGAGVSASTGKSVWFELVADEQLVDPGAAAAGGSPAAPEPSIEELLAAWSDAEEDSTPSPAPVAARSAAASDVGGSPSTSTVDVLLPALDAPALLAAKEQMDDVLRELQLLLLDLSSPSGTGPDVEVARRLDRAARDFDDVRRQVRQQVSRAVAAGRATVELQLRLPPGTAARASAYRDAAQDAEALAAAGGLLSVVATPALHAAVRRAYLAEVIAAAGQ